MTDDSQFGPFEYDVCLSFAGEQRSYVERVAAHLVSAGVRVFFDDYERVELWGKDLYAHLDDVYQRLGRYCVLFAAAEYAQKVWTSHERRSAQARALREKKEYLLPARFDDTPIPGLPDTIHYIDLRTTSPEELADLIQSKVGRSKRSEYMPPNPDLLYERLGIEDDPEAQEDASRQAWSFLQVLRRMDRQERRVIVDLFRFGCEAELPDNIHINTDLLRRIAGLSVGQLKRVLGGLRSLGFTCSVRDSTDHEHDGAHTGPVLGQSQMFVLDWVDLSDDSDYPALLVAHEMIAGATAAYCEQHGREALERLDFSQLSSDTAVEDSH